jgi:hypothetical protein
MVGWGADFGRHNMAWLCDRVHTMRESTDERVDFYCACRAQIYKIYKQKSATT